MTILHGTRIKLGDNKLNIFALDICPRQAAKWHCDKHCGKMILETAQILCANFHLQNVNAPYKKTHVNHPSTIWARTSLDNFKWTLDLGTYLGEEYTERYKRIHKSSAVIDWCRENAKHMGFDSEALTPFSLAMPDEYKVEDPVESYRNYYRLGKAHLHQWKQHKPPWI